MRIKHGTLVGEASTCLFPPPVATHQRSSVRLSGDRINEVVVSKRDALFMIMLFEKALQGNFLASIPCEKNVSN